eukprot:CAMPEP_0183730962 /NCGR_PEP_ID=MMETSP0737-20130205/33969_1 /TAXON_ID=385413 /ORGANISM="Thalassiosira miniscula, Strain CCMP1093" /LENGTH=204 /DNA_ID=CAMNT_0025963569 /DNA_START=459 /DNA_END=1073 /DNA_ORIENTATION=-
MTSVSIQSPVESEVFSFFETLSPPPTPLAKRGRHFFPSNASTPVPMFFPKSQSLLSSPSARRAETLLSRSSPANKEAMAQKQLASLASRPVPIIRLVPRKTKTDTSQVNRAATSTDIKKIIQAGQTPPLPFSFPNDSFDVKQIKSAIPQVPSLSDSTASSDSESNMTKPGPVAGPKLAKLPSFQRSGMHRRTVHRCNSYVARSA